MILPPLTLLPIFIFLPLWFPNGRFLTRRWRKSATATVALMLILSLAMAVAPTFRQNNSAGLSYPLDNPLGLAWLPSWWGPFFASALNLLMILGSLGAVTSMILRFKRAGGDERQQMKLWHGSKITNPSLQLRRSGHRLKSMAREGNLLKQVGDRLFDSFLVRFNALRLLVID